MSSDHPLKSVGKPCPIHGKTAARQQRHIFSRAHDTSSWPITSHRRPSISQVAAALRPRSPEPTRDANALEPAGQTQDATKDWHHAVSLEP
jgi:hypothetical protein